jgi:pimeloyl-ACP methyl ester carboxylesterase
MFMYNTQWLTALLFGTRPRISIDSLQTGVSAMSPNIVLIHGANATSLTFAHIRNKLPNFNYINIDYSPYGGFYNNLETIVDTLKDVGPSYIIGHSFGGIYALHLSQRIETLGGVTIATPFGGSSAARWAKIIAPSYLIFHEVGRKSKPIVDAQSFELPGTWTNLVGSSGSAPWISGDNDGVLTHRSMTCRDDIPTMFIDSNHSEIVCHDDTISAIKNHIIPPQLKKTA